MELSNEMILALGLVKTEEFKKKMAVCKLCPFSRWVIPDKGLKCYCAEQFEVAQTIKEGAKKARVEYLAR